MNNTATNTATCPTVRKQIGKTTYIVRVHFSKTANSMTLPHCSVMPTVCWDLRHSRPWIMPKAFTKSGLSPTPARTAGF